MLIYNYDSTTGLFLNSSTARENPRAPGQYLMPANATASEPTPAAGQVALYIDDDWTYQNDLSGTYYSTQSGELGTNSDPITMPGGMTELVPPTYDVATEVLSWTGSAWLVEAKPVEQDYMAFWVGLISSTYYARVKAEASTSLTSNVAATEFIALLGDAKAGMALVPAIQVSLDTLLSIVVATSTEQTYLTDLFTSTGLDDKYILNFQK